MNILVVRTDKLGDFITALPAMYILKHHDANNKIIACVAPLNEALAKSCAFIDEVIVDDGKSSVFELSRKMQNAEIDISVTLFSNTRVALAQFLARIPQRVAPATKIAQIFYTDRIKQKRSEVKMAEFEYNIELAKTVFETIDTNYPKPLLEFDDSKKKYEVFCINNAIEKEVIAFHIGFGGSSDANWNVDEYESLIRTVLENKKYQVLLTFGPDETHLYEEMQERLKGEDVVFYLSLEGLIYFAKLISNFRLFVSTSTGTFHLASLVGTPTMTFFGDSLFASSARWRGVGDEQLQHNFMIPKESHARAKLLEDIQSNFWEIIDA
jgi:ADP-heptose:LPS heptosyltransferase